MLQHFFFLIFFFIMNKFSNANKSLTRYEDTQKQRPGSG